MFSDRNKVALKMLLSCVVSLSPKSILFFFDGDTECVSRCHNGTALVHVDDAEIECVSKTSVMVAPADRPKLFDRLHVPWCALRVF